MSKEDIENSLNKKIAGGVLISACNLCFNIAVISSVMFLAVLFLIVFSPKHCHYCTLTALAINIALFLAVQFYCIRLKLDKTMFEYIYDNDSVSDISAFNEAMRFFFNIDTKDRTMASRWEGTKHLLKMTFVLLIIQICIFTASAVYCIA